MQIAWWAAMATMGILLISGQSWAGPPGGSPGREYSAVERISPDRLRAAQADADRYEAARRAIPPFRGLTDYRAAIHIHAGDSDHTGGTLPELLRDARSANVSIIMLSDHFRPPRDFMDGWRGLKDGVLFIPGAEAMGFLLYPDESVMAAMDGDTEGLIAATTRGTGLIFLSHVEERTDHSMAGLTGMEIYNRHYDAMDDSDVLMTLALMMTDPSQAGVLQDSVKEYHEAFLACQMDYPHVYIGKWDVETQHQRVVGIGAIDCHHNQVLIVKMVDEKTVLLGTNVDADDDMRTLTADAMPSIAAMTEGHQPGDELVRLDLDTYRHSFRTMSNHILACELTEPAVREALADGHVYVSHDWMCDPTGFRFTAVRARYKTMHVMGDELTLVPNTELTAMFPVACTARLVCNGKVVKELEGDVLTHVVTEPGAYRVEGWLRVDGEMRPWIYSNPIYIRGEEKENTAVVGMEHVAINVADPAGVVDWFVRNLDMRVARKVGGPTNTHFLADAAGGSMIEVYHNPAAPVPDYATQDPLVLHLAFTVDDVSAVRDRLLAAGATPVGEIVVTDSGDELAMLRSPHGIAVQLARRADPMLPLK